MAISFNSKTRIRKTFGRIPEVAPMPNLIEVQRSSYDHFLQMEVPPEQRASVGLQEVFKSVFPIRDFSERAQLEFVRYELETPQIAGDHPPAGARRRDDREEAGRAQGRRQESAARRSSRHVEGGDPRRLLQHDHLSSWGERLDGLIRSGSVQGQADQRPDRRS